VKSFGILDDTLARNDFGWKPDYETLEETVRDFVQEVKTFPKRIKRLELRLSLMSVDRTRKGCGASCFSASIVRIRQHLGGSRLGSHHLVIVGRDRVGHREARVRHYEVSFPT
jgi:hypothetical protein